MSYRQTPRTRDEIRSLMYTIDGASSGPTSQQVARISELGEEVKAAYGRFEEIKNGGIRSINEQVSHLPRIMVKGKKTDG